MTPTSDLLVSELVAAGAPVPPRNVRIAYPDGRAVPVECCYDGLCGDTQVWVVVVPSVVVLDRGFRVEADAFPAKAALRLGVAR